MVILKVGLLREPPVLCTSGKTYQLSSFSFKNFTLYIYSPVHTRKTSRTSPRVSEPRCNSDLVSRLCTSSLTLDIALLDFALSHFCSPMLRSRSPTFLHTLAFRASLRSLHSVLRTMRIIKNSFHLNLPII